jgi:hypothetical protein
MTQETSLSRVEKLATGMPGFDVISDGGLPRGRATLVAGTAGSAKTIFATQFLVEGITHANENGVFVTFEDRPADMRLNMASFGWDLAGWVAGRLELRLEPVELDALVSETTAPPCRGARRLARHRQPRRRGNDGHAGAARAAPRGTSDVPAPIVAAVGMTAVRLPRPPRMP